MSGGGGEELTKSIIDNLYLNALQERADKIKSVDIETLLWMKPTNWSNKTVLVARNNDFPQQICFAIFCRYSCGPTVYDEAHIGHAWYARFVCWK